ncbi:MAG: OmpA family protein [Tahibacter sp.]
MNRGHLHVSLLLLGGLALGGCASTPRGPAPEIVRLQEQLDQLHRDPRVARNADPELSKADIAVSALAREGRRLDRRMFDHGVYLADRLVQTAEAEGLARYAEQRAKELGAERETLLLQARSKELDVARRTAGNAIAVATLAQERADAERANAADARRDADAARSELDQMRAKLSELEARQTERGLVITLGDVLFEVDRSELRAGATRNLDKLVAALREDERTTIAIEGHTDSTGSRDHNLDLSSRRAESVQTYLTTHGIAGSRVSARGMGQDYPVADNGSASGRLQNRRVEVIVQTTVVK